MSNKIVPSTYRHIIDDVIGNMRAEFDDYGVSEEVLSLLQDKWETKVIASRVAEFEPVQSQPPPPPAQAAATTYQPQQLPSQPTYQLPPPPAHYVKTEPMERSYVSLTPSAPMQQFVLPPINGHGRPNPHGGPPGHQSVLVLPRGAPPQHNGATATPSPTSGRSGHGGGGGRIPQLDGPSYTPATSLPGPSSRAPPTIPQLDGPSSSGSTSSTDSPPGTHVKTESGVTGGNEEINSDLDDSDSDVDNDEDPTAANGADIDIVFCTYDKVARVKNKWKCVLKDGMIHVNGKDYLFAKCNGEFEW